LREIARYTLRQWGPRQQQRYAGLLAAGLQTIAERRLVPRRFSRHYPEVFVSRCEHHYIFYMHPDGEKPRILAVLHENMDLVSRLAERLTP
jgi:plasmid stabilization system protein ParE